MTTNLQAIVLAAGKSCSFNTDKTKLAEKICGQPMVLYPTKLLESMAIHTTVVTGYQKELVQSIITTVHDDRIHFVVQEEQQGTAHAIECARHAFKDEHILVMNGDTPLVTQEIIENLFKKHLESGADVSFITAHNGDPSGANYGRVIKSENDIQIIEAKDFTGDWSDHCCVNAGIYIVTKSFLESNIEEIEKNEASGQYYFSDIIRIASSQNKKITMVEAPFDRIRGINNYQELWAAEQVKRAELIKYWMDRGVRFSVAQNVHIDLDVTIGTGTYIGCGVHILKGSTIGKNCTIQEFASLENAVLEDNVEILPFCIIKDSSIASSAQVGPFAHITSGSCIGEQVIIGNFVEVKRSTVGAHTKAKHLTYLGDAEIGSHVNIGAGTITSNHNGVKKQKTVIEDNAYIGSNNALVAPVTIGKNAYTAAGSTITEDVPADALAIARSRQTNKDGYALKLKAKKKNESTQAVTFHGAIKTHTEQQNENS